MRGTHVKRWIASICVLLLCIGVLRALSPVTAFADDLGAYFINEAGESIEASPQNAWNEALKRGTGMGITRGWTLSGRLDVPDNKSVRVELNGNVINRSRSSAAAVWRPQQKDRLRLKRQKYADKCGRDHRPADVYQ